MQLGQRRELGLRQIFDDTRGEDRRMALHGDQHQEADLIVEHIARLLGGVTGHNFQLFTSHSGSDRRPRGASLTRREIMAKIAGKRKGPFSQTTEIPRYTVK